MNEHLTQEEVDALEEGTVIVIRWAWKDGGRGVPVRRRVVIYNGRPHVREIKPSGFPCNVPLYPVADADNPKRIRVSLPDSR